MAGLLQPLAKEFKIVNDDGTPTDYFIRWAQQKQIDISGGITQGILEDYLAAHPLQAGSGISLTPDGNLSSSPTISAIASAILDQISTTRGTVLFRGASNWQGLGPGTSGQVLQTNGAGADPTWVTPTGGGGGSTGELPLVPPILANFTYQGNASGSLAANANGLIVNAPNNGSTYNGRAAYLGPVASFANMTITARLRRSVGLAQSSGGCNQIFIRNSSNGRMLVFGDGSNGASPYWQRWTNDTTFNANISTGTFQSDGGALGRPWRRIVVTGSSAAPQFSPDGYNWDTGGFAAEPYGTYLTAAGGAADQIGFSSHTVNGSWNYTVCQHFTVV